MSKHTQAPPLYIWAILGLVFIFSQWVLFHYAEELFADEETTEEVLSLGEKRTVAQLALIKPHYQQQLLKYPDEYHVVVIGSSITNNGISCTETLVNESEFQFGKKIVVSKFFSPGRPLKAMVDYGGLTELLLETRPDLILIETDILAFDFGPYRSQIRNKGQVFKQEPKEDGLIPLIFAKRVGTIRALQQNRLNLIATVQQKVHHTAPPFTSEPCGNMIASPQMVDTFQIKPRKRYPIPFEKQDYAHRFIQELKKVNTDVILLHHPSPASLEKLYEASDDEQEVQQLLKRFQDEYNLPFWHCPIQFPYIYYRDQAHMNEKGREKYGSWLLQQIHQHINNP